MPFFHLAPLSGEVFDSIAEECHALYPVGLAVDVCLIREALSRVPGGGGGTVPAC